MYLKLQLCFYFMLSIIAFTTSATSLKPIDSLLTPLGGLLKGNSEGTIPPWTGGGLSSIDLTNLIKEQAKLTINIKNYKKYIHRLSSAQIHMIKRFPDSYKIYIYKTLRTQRTPQWLYNATEKNKTSVKLENEGTLLSGTWPGVPFPKPKSGVEVVWNHLLSWRGVSFEANMTEALVYPQKRMELNTKIKTIFYYFDKKRHKLTNSKILSYISSITAPAEIAGDKLLVNDYINTIKKPRQAWIYSSNTRKVQRVPAAIFDNTLSNSGGLRVVDEVNMYNGSPELYHWRIVEKKEMYIPYNNQNIAFSNIKKTDLMAPNHINSSLIRNELHRVWVVEGILKEGKQHLYQRRIFYIDEDSWVIVISESYNKKNELWRTAFSHLLYYPSMPGVFSGLDSFYEAKREMYFTQWFRQEGREGIKFQDTLYNKRNFSPSALRREVKR